MIEPALFDDVLFDDCLFDGVQIGGPSRPFATTTLSIGESGGLTTLSVHGSGRTGSTLLSVSGAIGQPTILEVA